MKKKRVLNTVMDKKEKNNELLITSLIIAFGINLFSTGILGFFNIEDKYLLLIIFGGIFSVFVLLTYFLLRIKNDNTTVEIRGLIIYDSDKNSIIRVPEYDISDEMLHFISSAFSENKALEKKWKDGKIGVDPEDLKENKKSENNNRIIIELIEYIFLTRLSLALEDYYNINNIYSKDIKVLSFDEMPSFLRKNRFLKLFSEDMENREAFIRENSMYENLQNNERVVYAIGEKGAIFNRFELTLPKEVKIKKNNYNELEFDMKFFTLKIKYIFDGYNSVVDPEFYDYYLNLNFDPIRYNDLDFRIELDVKFKNRILFTNKKIENYMWVDKLLSDLTKHADIETFFNRINWESNKCIIRCLKTSEELKEISKDSKQKNK